MSQTNFELKSMQEGFGVGLVAPHIKLDFSHTAYSAVLKIGLMRGVTVSIGNIIETVKEVA